MKCEICGDAEQWVLVCLVCDDEEEFADLAHLAAHVRSMHPDDYPDLAWPDGEPVYFEEEVT